MTYTNNTTMREMKRWSVELHASRRADMEYTKVFLKCLMSWDGPFF